MERFRYMTTSVSCTNESLDITFTDDETFEYAKGVWDWVNGADNHSFVMVAGAGDCGWNDYRTPFTVFDIQYDEAANLAHLVANASTWQDAVHSFTLDVGHVKSAVGETKRGETGKDTTINFNHQFPIGYTALSVPPLGIALSCASCGTSGEFLVSVHMETTLGVPRELTVSLAPRGVSMNINPSITLSVDVGPALAKEFELFAIPLQAIVIPGGVMNIGLSIPFTIGMLMGPLSIWGSVSGGVKLAIPDEAILTMNILDPDAQASGWDPIVTTTDIVLDARLTGTLRTYTKIGPALSVNALGTGAKLEATIGPFIQARAEAVASTGAACPDDPQGRHFAVDLNPTYGILQNIGLSTSMVGVTKPVFGIETALWVQQLPILCYPFGKGDNITNDVYYEGDRPAPAQTVTPGIATGAAANAAWAQHQASQTVEVVVEVPAETVMPEL